MTEAIDQGDEEVVRDIRQSDSRLTQFSPEQRKPDHPTGRI